MNRGFAFLAVAIVSMLALACSSSTPTPAPQQPAQAPQPTQPPAQTTAKLSLAGIPDQEAQQLSRRFEGVENYLSETLGVEVEYVPTTNYAATVVAFEQGDIQLAWFGGLTGVQARDRVPGSMAIAQRPSDTEFHSKFIVSTNIEAETLEDLKGLTFTFGSESSTSGHLMPRHFLKEADVEADSDFDGPPNYSGSHTTTWKFVESGAFQAGVLNELVWDTAIANGEVDTSKVRELMTTPPYFDYNWTVRGDMDEQFGAGFTEKVQQALLDLDDPELLKVFSPDGERFIESNNENYAAIKEVGESLGLIR
jgi:phosphonate transport system substrate-binding protein